jgi:hypothetical protein
MVSASKKAKHQNKSATSEMQNCQRHTASSRRSFSGAVTARVKNFRTAEALRAIGGRFFMDLVAIEDRIDADFMAIQLGHAASLL